MDNMKFAEVAGCSISRPRGSHDDLDARGRFRVEHWRDGKLLGVHEFPNAITNEGKNALLNMQFNGVAAIAQNAWHMLLVDGAGTPVTAATDTYAHIGGTNGWTENTAYAEAGRPLWGQGTSTAQTTTNCSQAIFTIASGGSGSVWGLAIVGGGTAPGTKGDAAGGGVLWAAAQFQSGTQTVANGDQLKVTYAVSC